MLNTIFWLVVFLYLCYGWGEFKRERKMRKIQNKNSLEMETL
jgi:hypothetical protein